MPRATFELVDSKVCLCTLYQQAATTLKRLAAEHVGQPACCATLCFAPLSMYVICIAVMPCQLKASGPASTACPQNCWGRCGWGECG